MYRYIVLGLCWALFFSFSAWAEDTGAVQTGEEFQTTNEEGAAEPVGDADTAEATEDEGGPVHQTLPTAASWTEEACMIDGSTEACLYKARRIIRRHQRKGVSSERLVQANVFLSRAAGLGNTEAELILKHITSLRNAAPVDAALAEVAYDFSLKNLNPKAIRRDFVLKALSSTERETLEQQFGIRDLEDIHNYPDLRTDPTAVRKILDLTVQASEQTKNLQALSIAATHGNLHSRTLLGQNSLALGDYTAAEYHFTQACAEGYGAGCANLGYLHYVQEDHLAAVSVLNKSCADGYATSCLYSYRVRANVRKKIRKHFYGVRPSDRLVNVTPEEVFESARPGAVVKSMRAACRQDVAEACSDLGNTLVPREVKREVKKQDFERNGDIVTEGRWLIQYVIVPGVHKYTIKLPYKKVIKPVGQITNQFILQPVSKYTVRPVVKFSKFWWNSFKTGEAQAKKPKRLKDVVIARPGEVAEAFRKACELDNSLTTACRYHEYFESEFHPMD